MKVIILKTYKVVPSKEYNMSVISVKCMCLSVSYSRENGNIDGTGGGDGNDGS